jgi:hypothetical protein
MESSDYHLDYLDDFNFIFDLSCTCSLSSMTSVKCDVRDVDVKEVVPIEQ